VVELTYDQWPNETDQAYNARLTKAWRDGFLSTPEFQMRYKTDPQVVVNVHQAPPPPPPPPPPPQIMRRCRYCEAVYPEAKGKCPSCGAKF
jgi:hypothetical protein